MANHKQDSRQRRLLTVKLKCTNEFCPYGPEWDRGEEVSRDASGKVSEHLRAESYSQQPTREDGTRQFDGKCLNCLDDERREDSNYP